MPFKKVLHYIPALLILIFGMLALHAAQTVLNMNDMLEAQINFKVLSLSQGPQAVDASEFDSIRTTVEMIDRQEKLLYWSVITIGFLGFVLFLLYADKLRKLDQAHEQKRLGDIEAAKDKEKVLEQLYQAQKMEAIGRLAGGIAHDFNNILAAINGYAEFLEEDLEPKSQEQGYAVNILKAGYQAKSLVDQMLAFSRRTDNETDIIDMRAPLQECLSMLKASLSKSTALNANIEIENPSIDGNATQISQVLMNLCVNAQDAMEDNKGTILVSLNPFSPEENAPLSMLAAELPNPKDTPPLVIEEVDSLKTQLYLGTFSQEAEYICLTVEDNGSGIPAQIVQKIFEPFFTTKPVEKGTGLGLSTVHGVVTAHKGALILETTIGKGTRFDLFFPLVESEADKKTIADYDIEKIAGKSILLVEDQDDVREMTKLLLERLEYKVSVAENGLEALDVLREQPDVFDLVITDHNMPKMTGLELVFQANMDFPDLPFILLSGYSAAALTEIMEQHEAIKAIVRKPVKKEDLAHQIAEVLLPDETTKAA